MGINFTISELTMILKFVIYVQRSKALQDRNNKCFFLPLIEEDMKNVLFNTL